MRIPSALSNWKNYKVGELSKDPQKVVEMLGEIGIKVEIGKHTQNDPNFSTRLTYDREKIKENMVSK